MNTRQLTTAAAAPDISSCSIENATVGGSSMAMIMWDVGVSQDGWEDACGVLSVPADAG